MNEQLIREEAIKATKASISFDLMTNNTIQVKCDTWLIEFLLDLIQKSEVEQK